eukprot:GHRR01030287.1.p1 GENE.GHRR01030287.1~~GHRR01030287.1.p1  ORF type:complete len:133 (+),score=35.19 GHRR01030287.1:548-946(+)
MDSSHQYGGQCILHMDVDSLFCQVEVLRNPWLRDIPLAIQQHEDVIAINYPAKQAGVKKHMKPKEAQAILSPAGGRLHHVYTEADGRVSYRPYRLAAVAADLPITLGHFTGHDCCATDRCCSLAVLVHASMG